MDQRIELHVLVRAYCAAWIALHSQNPTGPHRLEQLGVVLRFEDPEA